MVVTILGGSAQSTPVLLDWLNGQRPLNSNFVIRLAGRDKRRLSAVARACRVLTSNSPVLIQEFLADAWAKSLAGADVVVIQVRIGGYEARSHDEFFPLKYGIPGDEGLGPGGLSAAIRTWPHLRDLLIMVQRYAQGALPLLLTSPPGLLLRLAAFEFPRCPIYGICELPFTTLQRLSISVGLSIDDVQFSYAGVNHLGWLYDVRSGGEDLICRYMPRTDGPLCDLVRRWHAVPLKYMRLHFQQQAVVDEQMLAGAHATRSAGLARLREESLPIFEAGTAADIRRALARRPAPWYTDAIGPLLLELNGESTANRPFFLSFAECDGAVRERPYRRQAGRFVLLPAEPPSSSIGRFVSSFMQYEERAATAIIERSGRKLAHALRIHPWTQQAEDAESLAKEIIHWTGFECLN